MSRTKQLTAVVLASLAFMASACNTIEGAGEDIQSGGEAISDAAK